MTDQFGSDVVDAYMGHVQDNAEESVRRIVAGLHDGHCRYETDSGALIQVRLTVDRDARSAHLDFTGTSPQQPGNANAPRSVVMAAVLYVFRTLVGEDIPLNSGCLKPLKVTIPPGSMLDPAYPAATVAGNVETSQAVTGALYGAIGGQAEGSGTMNNLTFGNDHVQYYETIASGSGAGDGFDGADAVQTHMTNSRLTDPEILEWRLPALLEGFTVRDGSGGAGGGTAATASNVESVSWNRSRSPCSPDTAASRRTERAAGSRGRSGSSTSSGPEAKRYRWRAATPPNWTPETCSWCAHRAAEDTDPQGPDPRT